MGKDRRSREDIIYCILKVIMDETHNCNGLKELKGPRKTRIQQGAYLDFNSFKQYFEPLVDNGFLQQRPDTNNNNTYIVTGRGHVLKDRLDAVYELCPGIGSQYRPKV